MLLTSTQTRGLELDWEQSGWSVVPKCILKYLKYIYIFLYFILIWFNLHRCCFYSNCPLCRMNEGISCSFFHFTSLRFGLENLML